MAVRFYADFQNDVGIQYRINIYDNSFSQQLQRSRQPRRALRCPTKATTKSSTSRYCQAKSTSPSTTKAATLRRG